MHKPFTEPSQCHTNDCTTPDKGQNSAAVGRDAGTPGLPPCTMPHRKQGPTLQMLSTHLGSNCFSISEPVSCASEWLERR